ncbi:MAG: RND transporter [Bacteroidia bacterium]|nr:MAG: RND transporter [Bacteroidia bacterium]
MKQANKLWMLIIVLIIVIQSCVVPPYTQKSENRYLPDKYLASNVSGDTLNSADIRWDKFFSDTTLVKLVEIALQNNQELNILTQEIRIAQNDVRFRKAQYLPFLGLMAGAALDKPGRYTFNGAVEENVLLTEDKKFPDPFSNLMLGVNFSWEIDIWKKLRNSKKAAMYKYLATREGRNFMQTRLVAEVAETYYELLALDNELEITQNYVDILNNAFEIVKQEKAAARTTELAVKRFEAEVLKNKSKIYYIRQQIVQKENQLNYLLGHFPQPIQRNSKLFMDIVPQQVLNGIPSQLLRNRPDIRMAEMELMATRMEVKSSRAEFYPSLRMDGIGGFNAYNAVYLFQSPASIIWGIAGELINPLINRNALKANYFSAIAQQNKAAYHFEQKVINAYTEVSNQIANVQNLQSAFELKKQQVDALNQSIDISVNLFKNARADYMEVLLTQRDALEAKYELVETKFQQMQAMINLYRALGGGWK